MAEPRTRRAIGDDYQAARHAGDGTVMRRPADLRTAVDAKISITRHRRWRPEVWRSNLQEIRELYEATMANWVNPALLPPFDDLVQDVTQRLRELTLD